MDELGQRQGPVAIVTTEQLVAGITGQRYRDSTVRLT